MNSPLVQELDLVVVGAGPAGIALVAEARAAGVAAKRIVALERAQPHSWVIRRYYPESKPVLANYKGIEGKCEGVLCIPDLTREETLSYLDRAILDSGVEVRYGQEVHRIARQDDGRLLVESSGGALLASVVVIAIGVLGRPNRPAYPVPRELSRVVLFDVTSETLRGRDVLVVGGGDTAMEYCQFLVQEGNRVALSYRGETLTRPNAINRGSVLALAKRGRLDLRLNTDVAGLEVVRERVRVRFLRPPEDALDVDRVVYALGGTTPENFLKSAGIEFVGDWPLDEVLRHERARPLPCRRPDGRQERRLNHSRLQHGGRGHAADLRRTRNLPHRPDTGRRIGAVN